MINADTAPRTILFYPGSYPTVDNICLTYDSTFDAIQNDGDIIFTTQMCFLSTALLNNGFHIIIFNDDMTDSTHIYKSKGKYVVKPDIYREINREDDLFELWIAGDLNDRR